MKKSHLTFCWRSSIFCLKFSSGLLCGLWFQSPSYTYMISSARQRPHHPLRAKTAPLLSSCASIILLCRNNSNILLFFFNSVDGRIVRHRIRIRRSGTLETIFIIARSINWHGDGWCWCFNFRWACGSIVNGRDQIVCIIFKVLLLIVL